MKKLLFSLSILALVGCKYKGHGNKDVLPQDIMPDTWNTTEATEQYVFDDEVEKEIDEKDHEEQVEEEEAHLDANGNYVYNIGEMTTITLPNDSKMEVGENSSENKLYRMLTGESFDPTDKTKGWITLDRVYFDTGKAKLTPESKKQVDNLAIIMEAFPTAQIKIGGYTDNVGGPEINQKLSLDRAESVMQMLEKEGVAKDRMKAEGYGQEHPICPANDTDLCKAQNRRVDIRVTQR